MQYLAASEYERYGLEVTTPEALVSAASALIDSICRRPSVWLQEYSERVRVAPGGRVRLSHLPLCAGEMVNSPLLRVRVRSAAPDGCVPELAREVSRAFGLAGAWSELDPKLAEFVNQTGEVLLPVQPLGLSYGEAEITYTAGFVTMPDAVKFACAQLVRNAEATPALNVRRTSVDQMQMEYFRDTLVDETVKRLLAPFVSVRMGA